MSSSLIRIALFLFVLMTCGSASSQIQIGASIDYANPQKFTLAGISVLGAEKSDVQAIKLFSGLLEGQEIMLPGEDISDAVRKLWKQRLFADIAVEIAEIRGDQLFLVIVVKELPRLGTFSFEGIKKSEADNLREKIDVKTGVIITENLKTKSINLIREYYIEKGFYNSKIIINERADPLLADAKQLIFAIDRGNKVKIEEIQMRGVQAMPASKLYRSMKETKQRKWWRVFKASKFIEENYADDKVKIIDRYNKEGFRNAKIISDSVYVINPSRVGIVMTIEEDKKFYFRNIRFVGNTKYSTGALDSVLNIQRGDVYNLELLQNRLSFNPNGRDVSSLYTDDGYLNFYAYPVESLVPLDSIDIEVRMNEGKQYRIGTVTVTGNTKTNDHVIYREIRTRPGDLFNRSDLIRSQRELAALNYFNPEAFDIRTNPRADEGLVDLEYVLEEKPSDQIELSGGWGGNRVVGSLGLSFNNFSMRNFFKKNAWSPLPTGDGQRLSLRAQTNGAFFQAYNLSFTEPWLGKRKPNSLSISAFRSVQSNGVRRKIDDEENPAYQGIAISGASVSFGQRWQKPDDWFVFVGGLGYQYFDLNNFGSFFTFNQGYSHNLAVNFTLERNSVSDPIYPTWGSRITLSGKFTPPYTFIGEKIGGEDYDYANMTDQEKFDWVEYYKIKFTAKWYTPLNKHKTNKLVLHSALGFGFLGNYNSGLGNSPFERFYLGGVFLSGFLLDGREIVNLRGYDDLSLTTPNQNTGAPVITKYTMELRYPMSLNPSATIFALGFVEAGRTWENFDDFNPFNTYRSAGAGLRIFLPMFGLLGFDYGWRLDDLPSAPQMARGQFHFSIGMNMGEL